MKRGDPSVCACTQRATYKEIFVKACNRALLEDTSERNPIPIFYEIYRTFHAIFLAQRISHRRSKLLGIYKAD
jgi:hypothetical protein